MSERQVSTTSQTGLETVPSTGPVTKRRPGRTRRGGEDGAYAIVGAFQVVTLMWLRDDYCDIDTVTDDLTQLLWPGVATAGD